MADPTTVPGLRLWLKADAGVATVDVGGVLQVTSWTNQAPGFTSESVAQATSAKQPVLTTGVLNSRPGVVFDGADDTLAMSGTLLDLFRNLGAAAIYFVAQDSTPTTNRTAVAPGNIVHIANGSSITSVRVTAALLKDDSDDTVSNSTLRAGGRRLDANGFASVAGANETWPRATFHVGTSVFDYTNASLSLFQDGAVLVAGSAFQTAGSTPDTASLGGAVGSSSNGSLEFLQGPIVELLVFQSLPTAAQRAEVHSYLQDRYAITVADYVPANATPTANAGPDQSVAVGQVVTLTGAASTDSDGTLASYNWTLPTAPAGSTAVLSGTGATRTFTADLAGTYTASLTVTDGGGATSAADTVSVVASAPVLAGPHVRVAGAYVQQTAPVVRIGGVYV